MRYAMVMYYPGEVRKNGPTAVKPGSQYGGIDPGRYDGDEENMFMKVW